MRVIAQGCDRLYVRSYFFCLPLCDNSKPCDIFDTCDTSDICAENELYILVQVYLRTPLCDNSETCDTEYNHSG